ncbi:MAG: septation protein A [Betaproteobacteria bacterium]|nr:septation protein A [Betaproteobacteria bacterium]
MKLLLDFFPILLFFVSYKLSDIYTATAVLMAATTVQMAVIYLRERSLQTMHKVTLVLVLGFGAMTLGLHDERFIKWKPTVLYCGMALALAVATWVFKKSPIKGLLGSQLELPDPVWSRLNVAWVLYCAFMALANAYVAQNFTTEEWVDFKLWGYVFPVAFILGQGIYISRHMQAKTDDEVAP